MPASTDLRTQKAYRMFVVLKCLNYETAYHQNQEEFCHLALKAQIALQSGQQPGKKSLKEAIIETHHFGTPKLLPRLITLWSAASAVLTSREQ